jgi:folate-dependent phosphoribosylglycinamide formyltransferase PurN
MMRIVLLAPTNSSLYSRLIAHVLHQMSEVRIVGVFVRRLWSIKRVRTDLRREGPRLLQKIFSKLIVPEGADLRSDKPLVNLSAEMELRDQTLSAFSRRASISYHRVTDFNSEVSEGLIRQLSPDLIVFTGGGLIRQNILEIPSRGVLNCHSGLLPRYRGMDTLEWTILETERGLPQVGLTLHYMDAGVDTGPILSKHSEELSRGESLQAVRARLEPEMVRLMQQGIRGIISDSLHPEIQDKHAGRQYFVIHPRLRRLAEFRLRSN